MIGVSDDRRRRGDRRGARVVQPKPTSMAVGVPGGGGVSTAAISRSSIRRCCTTRVSSWDPSGSRPPPATSATRSRPVARCARPTASLGVVVCGGDGNGVRARLRPRQRAATFGHDGAGGQLAWADPGTGVSFAYVTNGLDRHLIRQWRRNVGINSRAAAIG